MTKRVFITGATGFIGANLTRRLVLDGYEVVALLREQSYHPFIENIPIKIIKGNINDRLSVEKGMRGCDYVYHCAAKISFNKYDYNDLYLINVLGTRNVLNVALESKIRKFIHISACAVYGYSNDNKEVRDENSIYNMPCRNAYAYTKKLAEDEVKKFCSRGLSAVIVNPCTVYGQGDWRLNSGSLIKAIYNNKLRLAPPGGTSVVSVDDVVNGLILILNKGRIGENYILADENIEYIDLINKIAGVVGTKGVRHKIMEFFYYPIVGIATAAELFNRDSTFITPQIAKELFRYKYFSSNKARRELGWEPKVGIGEAIEKAFEFYRAYGLL